jgi:hypothetical protein
MSIHSVGCRNQAITLKTPVAESTSEIGIYRQVAHAAHNSLLLLPADVTEHIRMDVQTDIGHVVTMLAGNQPDDFADRAFGIVSGHARKSAWVNRFISCQLRHIV